ncbi:MAG: InlB B-repeat-containing protein [Oscillospiraceae bacterium]|jgi:uncharacterized repeat protein (TIGR02543 family)|nr:InlB B-repeat-containing protein [Oscillospiraceae bacterium]
MMTTMKNRIYLRRGIAALVSLTTVLTMVTASLSSAQDDGPYFIDEPVTYTAYASIVEYDDDGILGLRVTVRDSANNNVTYSGNFTFQWQFRTGESAAWGNAPGTSTSSVYNTATATTAGFYRCEVTFTNNSDIPATVGSNGNPFYSDNVRVTRVPNTRPYTAYILGGFTIAGTNNVQVNLSVIVRNQSNDNVTDSGKFEFQWERQDKVDGLPVGNFIPIAGENDITLSGVFNSPLFFRCRVTYTGGDGEPQDSDVFYTAPVDWTPILTYATGTQSIFTTSATTTVGRNLVIPTDRPPGFPPGPAFGQGQFATNTAVAASVNAAGQLMITITNHNLQGGGNINTIGSLFELFRLTDAQTGDNLFDGVGIISTLPNGNNPYTFQSASPLPGEGQYFFSFRVWRQNPAFDVIITGYVNIGATASDGALTDVDSTPIPPGGIAGDSINVDYPTYPSNTTGISGVIPVTFQHPAYRITYDPNSGSGSMNIPPNLTFTSLPAHSALFNHLNPHAVLANTFTPPSAAYGFAGWFTEIDEDGKGVAGTRVEVNTVFNTQTNNIKLFATWSQDIFTITFNPTGGSVNPTSAVTQADRTLAFLPTPTRDGYTFVRWEKGDGTAVTSDTEFDSDTTIFAQWVQSVFIVTYDPGDGEGNVPDSEVIAGTSYTVRGADTFIAPEGYIFDGWFDPDAGISYSGTHEFNSITKDITLIAQWKLKPELNFVNSNGTASVSLILLPADNDANDGMILNGENIRVYFWIPSDADIEDVEFYYAGVTIKSDPDDPECEVFTFIPEYGIWYFDLNRAGVITALQNSDYIEIEGKIFGDVLNKIIIRRIGLFDLH